MDLTGGGPPGIMLSEHERKGGSRVERYIIGYAMDRSLPGVTEQDAGRLSHLNLAFGLIREGLLDLSMLPHMDLVSRFKRWAPGLRVVLSVGGWGAGGFSAMAMAEAGRRAFAASCLEAVERYGLDGIDIDWEYPCSDQAGIDADPMDRENYTLLLQALREALGPARILSVAVGAGEDFIAHTHMDRVTEIVDYVQLMTYDFRGAFSDRAGHHAALGPSRGDTTALNARAAVELFFRAGVPYEKMVLGAAFYGRSFAVPSDADHGLLQPSGPGTATFTYGELTEAFRRENGFAEYWDEAAEAAWLWNGREFISFESPEAIRRKCAYVREKGLRGIMYWEHGEDPRRELLGVIAGSLS